VKTIPEGMDVIDVRYPRSVRSSADECRSPATEPSRSPAPFADRTALSGSRTCVEHPINLLLFLLHLKYVQHLTGSSFIAPR
jgi:hypothetical protein